MRPARPVATVLLGLVLVGCGATPAATPAVTPSGAVAVVVPDGVASPERMTRSAPVRPPQPALTADYRVELVDDPCVDRDLAAPPSADPALTLLDRSYALASWFVPDDLVAASEAGLSGSSAAKLVSAAMVADLAEMRAAAEAAGLTLVIDSAYRSFAAQAATFDAWAAQLGPLAASLRAARPGHSEHQLGTALDFSSPGWSGRFGDWAIETAEGAWLAEHGWEYGFVMSYPAGTQDETCFGYEPWHYRWIGRDLAAEHRAEGGALRAFLAERAGG